MSTTTVFPAPSPVSPFKPGDKVIRTGASHGSLNTGEVGTVQSVYHERDRTYVKLREDAAHPVYCNFRHSINNLAPYIKPGLSAEERAAVKLITGEADPSGKSANEPGAKLDAGKLRPGLVLGGFARALLKVTEVGTFGAAKYTDNGWQEVPNGEDRYEDAGLRHWLKSKVGEEFDPESNVEHLAHEAWNALARLDLALRRKEKK